MACDDLTLESILSTDSWSSGRLKINDNFSLLNDEICEIIETLSLDKITGDIELAGDLCADNIRANIIALADCNALTTTIVLDGITGFISSILTNSDRLEAEKTLRLSPNTDPTGGVEGMLRWSGVDLFVYDGSGWVSLTGGTVSTIWLVNGTTGDLYFDPASPQRGVAIGTDTADSAFHLVGDLILDISGFQSPAPQDDWVLTLIDSATGRSEFRASPIGTLGGTGTTDRHAKFTGPVTLGDGLIGDDGTDITVYGKILPDTTSVYDLGSAAQRFKDLYVSSTIDFASDLRFDRAGTEKMRIDTTGVSIGTLAAAAYTLDLSGTLKLDITGAANTDYVLSNDGSGVAEWKSIATIGGFITINSLSPIAGDFLLTGGTGIDIDPNSPGDNELTFSVDESVIDHDLLLNASGATNNHTGIDTHIADSTIHYPTASIDHTAISNIGSNSHVTIDAHIADSTLHFIEGAIDHTAISNIGTNTHAQIDTHIASSSNPHSVTLEEARTAGSIFAGNVNMGGFKITSADDPTAAQDYATKAYVDTAAGVSSHLSLTDIGTNTHADIDTHIADTTNPHLVSLEQARTVDDTLAGDIDMDGNFIKNLPTPVDDDDAASKVYVDNNANGRVKVTTLDTSSDFLESSLSAGAGITFQVLNPGGNEILEITADEFVNQFAFSRIIDIEGNIAQADAQTDGLYMISSTDALVITAINDANISPGITNADTVLFELDLSEISHDDLADVSIDEHREMDDSSISNSTLWSSQKIIDYFDTEDPGYVFMSDGVNTAAAEISGDTFSLIGADPFITILVGDDSGSPVGSPASLYGDHAQFFINVDDASTTATNLWSADKINSLIGSSTAITDEVIPKGTGTGIEDGTWAAGDNPNGAIYPLTDVAQDIGLSGTNEVRNAYINTVIADSAVQTTIYSDSNSAAQIDFNSFGFNDIYISTDNGAGSASYLYLMDSGGASSELFNGVGVPLLVYGDNIVGLSVGYGDYNWGGFGSSIIIGDNSAGAFSTGAFDKPAIVIGSRSSTVNTGVTNSVIVGGVGITAKTDDTTYVDQLGFFETGTIEGLLTNDTLTADRAWLLPDESGTIALSSEVPFIVEETSRIKPNFSGSPDLNTNTSDYSTIAGGGGNSITGAFYYNFIGGGSGNSIINSPYNVIGGGANNSISGYYTNVITGGAGNTITDGYYNVISGGADNTITNYRNNFMGSGFTNTMLDTGYGVMLAGNYNILDYSWYSGVLSGFNNYIYDSNDSWIFAGSTNVINTSSDSFIFGASSCNIGTGVSGHSNNFMGPGDSNDMYGHFGAILLGRNNVIHYDSSYCTILNGRYNLTASYDYVSIMGSSITATRDNCSFVESLDIRDKLFIQLSGASPDDSSVGTEVLVGGTATVNTTAVTANSIIFLTAQIVGGVQGILSTGAVVAGTSFVIDSSNGADTSTVGWLIIN